MCGAFFSTTAFSDDSFNLKIETFLYKSPSEDSEVFGKLPRGTEAEFLNDIQSGFLKIRVELDNNELLEGWVLEASSSRKLVVDPRKKRLKIPRDEALLLYRDPTFFYGLQLGPNLGLVSHAQLPGVGYGLGLTVGPHIGTFLTKQFPIQAEANFVLLNGGIVNTSDLRFNFLEVGALTSYLLKKFQFSLGVFYAMGLGTTELPTNMQLNSASDLNSVALAAGAGYLVKWNYIDVILSFRYRLHLLFTQYTFQNFNLQVAFQLKG